MSGNLMDSATSLAMHAQRRGAGYYADEPDPLRGPRLERGTNYRRRRPPRLPQGPAHGPRQVYQVTPGDPSSYDLDKIADHENLALVWRALRAKGGHGPGSDLMTYNLSPSEYFALLRNLSEAIRERRYIPGPTRPVQIPKATGGFRRLEIPNILDRVAGAALVAALRPVMVDRLPRYFGAAASVHGILARMTVQAEDSGWYSIAVDDVRNFFPSIPRARATDCMMREADRWGVSGLTLVQQGIPWLTRQLIYGHEGESRTIGLSQGTTCAPLVAAIVLMRVLDSTIDRRIENRMVLHRFVDNVHLQGPDHSEVRSVMDDIQWTLNQNGMTLKEGGTVITDVRQPASQTILGVKPRWRNGQLLFDIPDDAWIRLNDKLSEATTGSGPQMAQSIVRGFITAYRPCLRVKADSAVDRTHKVMRKGGTYSISKDTITTWIMAARDKWTSELQNIRNPQHPLPQQEYQTVIPEMETGLSDVDNPIWE